MQTPSQSRVSVGRPVVITTDPDLLDDLLRLAAAASVDVDVFASARAARAGWAGATMVLIGSDLAAAVAEAGLPRRAAVLVIHRDDSAARRDRRGRESTVEMSTPQLLWSRAIEVGAETVVELPDGEPWLVDRLGWSDPALTRLGAATVIAVLGGSGGAGASTLAGALSLAAARRGRSALLVDLDPWSGGLDLMMGIEQVEGPRWPAFIATSGRLSGAALTEVLPRAYGVSVLSHARSDSALLSPRAITAVLEAGIRGHDVVVLDLPRQRGEVVDVGLAHCDRVLCVVSAEVRAVAAASRVLAEHEVAQPLGIVVRTGRGQMLDPITIANSLGLPLAAVIASERRLSAETDAGEPPGWRRRGRLSRVADALLEINDQLAAVA